MIELALSVVGAVLSAAGLICGCVALRSPPNVRQLQLRVIELENDYAVLAERLTSRQRKEGMEKARDAHELRRKQSDAVLSEAEALISAAKQQQHPTVEQRRAALRAQLAAARSSGKPS